MNFERDNLYLQNSVGGPLTRCIAELTTKRPSDPIEWIAKWLYRYIDGEIYFYEKKFMLNSLMRMRLEIYRIHETRQRNINQLNKDIRDIEWELRQNGESMRVIMSQLAIPGIPFGYMGKLTHHSATTASKAKKHRAAKKRSADEFSEDEENSESSDHSLGSLTSHFSDLRNVDGSIVSSDYQKQHLAGMQRRLSEAFYLDAPLQLDKTETSRLQDIMGISNPMLQITKDSRTKKSQRYHDGDFGTEQGSGVDETGRFERTSRKGRGTSSSRRKTDHDSLDGEHRPKRKSRQKHRHGEQDALDQDTHKKHSHRRRQRTVDRSRDHSTASSYRRRRKTKLTSKEKPESGRSVSYTGSSFSSSKSEKLLRITQSRQKIMFLMEHDIADLIETEADIIQLMGNPDLLREAKRWKRMMGSARWSVDCNLGLVCHHSILGLLRGRPTFIPPETPEWWEKQGYIPESLYDHEVYSSPNTDHFDMRKIPGKHLSNQNFVTKGSWLRAECLRNMDEDQRDMYLMQPWTPAVLKFSDADIDQKTPEAAPKQNRSGDRDRDGS